MQKLKRALSLALSLMLSVGSFGICTARAAEENLSADNSTLSRTVATEGMVLLENKDNSLPLKKGETIAVFGKAQIDFVKGGAGSGDVYVADPVNALEGLETKQQEGKVAINKTLADRYKANSAYVPTQSEIKAAANESKTAVVVISRTSAENADRSLNNAETGYYLTAAEKSLLSGVSAAGFQNIIVVLNIGAVMDTAWIDEYPAVKSVLIAWQPGMRGGDALADVLVGDVTPSGKLVDTFAKDYTDYPSADAFGDNRYYEDYTEDIYVGYRWFETFDPNYERVNYEFGYGLSYTDFSISDVQVTHDAESIHVDLKVKNIGDTYSGKEVVQVYFSAPQGKLGKPAKQLAAYAKTTLLAPGAEQTLRISFAIADMASYDDTGKVKQSAYVLENGAYNIYVGNSVRNAGKQGVRGSYTVKEAAGYRVTEQLTQQLAPIQLEKRLLANGEYEQLDTIYTTDNDFGIPVSANSVTKIEAEDSSFREQRSPILYNENDLSICVLDLQSQGGNRWASFDLDVEKAGSYDLSVAVSNNRNNLTNSVKVYVNEVAQQNAGQIDIPATDGPDNDIWNIVELGTLKLNLPAGKCSLRIEFTNGSSLRGVFDYFKLIPAGATDNPEQKQEKLTAIEENVINSGITYLDVYNDNSLMDAFLAQFTTTQLADLLHGKGSTLPYGNTGCIGYLPEFGIPAAETADGPAGVRFNAGAVDIDGGTAVSTTAWPISTCVACTWNDELVEEMGIAFGKEAKKYKIDVLLAPGMNIHRNPLCGRNFEYYSEDPLISGKMAAALTRGVQSQKVAVSLKHFAANNREYERKNMDSRMSERALREIYLKGFEIAVKESDPWCVMSSYNRVNGVATSESEALLTNILRDEWGFSGAVITDWRNTGTAYKEILAGGDVKMPWDEASKVLGQTAGALANGELTRADLEACAARTLTLVMRTNATQRMLESSVLHTISANKVNRIKAMEYAWKSDGVGSEACSDTDGGTNPNYTQNGAWLRYDVQVEKAGVYTVYARVAAQNRPNARIVLSANGRTLGTIHNDSGSTGWQEWKNTSAIKVTLPAGRISLQLDFPGDAVNLNYLEFTRVIPAVETTITPVEGKVTPGDSVQLEASCAVSWQLGGNTSQQTTIDQNGKLTVGEDEKATSLTITATSKTDAAAIGTLVIELSKKSESGDVDGDGTVNVSDIIKVKNLIMAGEWTDAELAAGDLNNNKELDVADIIAIKNLIMGA